jgi:hypothetical protein
MPAPNKIRITLDDFTTAELLAEIEARKIRKVIRLQTKKQPKVWACRCGYRYVAGSHDNESYVDFGMLWHKPCMPPQGQLSSNPQMSMGSVNV